MWSRDKKRIADIRGYDVASSSALVVVYVSILCLIDFGNGSEQKAPRPNVELVVEISSDIPEAISPTHVRRKAAQKCHSKSHIRSM